MGQEQSLVELQTVAHAILRGLTHFNCLELVPDIGKPLQGRVTNTKPGLKIVKKSSKTFVLLVMEA